MPDCNWFTCKLTHFNTLSLAVWFLVIFTSQESNKTFSITTKNKNKIINKYLSKWWTQLIAASTPFIFARVTIDRSPFAATLFTFIKWVPAHFLRCFSASNQLQNENSALFPLYFSLRLFALDFFWIAEKNKLLLWTIQQN